ncbi:MAG: protein rep [Firmicutes bacterium]|nr:protein rep [Bacillota bacterium]
MIHKKKIATHYNKKERFMDLRPISITQNIVGDIIKKIERGSIFVEFYSILAHEDGSQTLYNKRDNLSNCSRYWNADIYQVAKTKDILRINLCHDYKYCEVCKKLVQASRLGRYTPEIEKMAEHHNLYHAVFTLPNCSSPHLKDTIKTMCKHFPVLVRYFKLDGKGNPSAKIKGFDLLQYGYAGCIRSLEVTFDKSRGASKEYHPHFHCIFAFKKGYDILQNKVNINDYSYQKDENGKRILTTLFSDFEILLQKVWYLLLHGQKVTLSAINSLKQGYDCWARGIEDGDYYEVFKYATKNNDENNNPMLYDQFKTLYFALRGCHSIQGYGIFRGIKSEENIDEDAFVAFHEEYMAYLRKTGLPINATENIYTVYENAVRYTYISRKKVYQIYKEQQEKDSGTDS